MGGVAAGPERHLTHERRWLQDAFWWGFGALASATTTGCGMPLGLSKRA